MKVKIDRKVCSVCGDKALGHNFNAVTCESCKAFFRRNALIQKEFKCPFNNQCEITKITRRFCQKCRLDKCFSIGMCKDLIMSEEDKVAKRQKIEENRAKKRIRHGFKSNFKKHRKETADEDSEDSNNSSTDSNDASVSDLQTNTSNMAGSECDKDLNKDTRDDTITSSIENITGRELCPIKEVPYNFQGICGDTNRLIDNIINNNRSYLKFPLSDCALSKCMLSKGAKNVEDRFRLQPTEIDAVLCEAIKLEYQMYPSIAQHGPHSKDLNEAEQAKLNELISASKFLLAPIDDELKNLMGEDYKERQQKILQEHPSIVDVVNLTGIGIRRVIIMAKKITAFKNMCQEDQVALLKGGCTEIMLLRSALNYDQTQQIWQIPHSMAALKVHVDVLKQAKGNMYHLHESFIKTFEHRMDENIVLILCAIILFTPERPKVVHEDVIKLEQNSYYYLLRRYLESIYAGCEARSTFLKLIQKIAEIHKVNKEFINVYLGCNPSQVEPLLIEIFDLKCKNPEDL